MRGRQGRWPASPPGNAEGVSLQCLCPAGGCSPLAAPSSTSLSSCPSSRSVYVGDMASSSLLEPGALAIEPPRLSPLIGAAQRRAVPLWPADCHDYTAQAGGRRQPAGSLSQRPNLKDLSESALIPKISPPAVPKFFAFRARFVVSVWVMVWVRVLACGAQFFCASREVCCVFGVFVACGAQVPSSASKIVR